MYFIRVISKEITIQNNKKNKNNNKKNAKKKSKILQKKHKELLKTTNQIYHKLVFWQ